MVRRVASAILSGLTLSFIPGCATDADRYDRSYISPQIEERTGFALGPETEPGATALPPGVTLEDGVSEDEAVAIALWNNAAFQEALSALGIHRADLVQAGLLPNPVFTVLLPLGPKQLEFTARLPLEWLWLRPRRVALAELECERAAALLVRGGLDLVRDVRVAFADLALARRQALLGEEAAALRKRIADVFQARLRAGDVSELEASQARIEALQAARQAAHLGHEVARVEERLRALLGLGAEPGTPEFTPDFSFDLSPASSAETSSARAASAGAASALRLAASEKALFEEAMAGRPDLRAAELAVEAASKRAGLARWDFIALSGLVDANEKGEDGFEMGPGLDIEIPLFDRNQGAAARTDAELERALRGYVTVRHAIAREVSDARTRILQAAEDVETWRSEILPALQAARGQARKAYEKGQTSMLPVLETERRLLDARAGEAEAAAGLRRARAELERSIGRRLREEEGKPPGAPLLQKSSESRGQSSEESQNSKNDKNQPSP
jgi:cobalt-zinc-cadmium efflux system outer membrane protein